MAGNLLVRVLAGEGVCTYVEDKAVPGEQDRIKKCILTNRMSKHSPLVQKQALEKMVANKRHI